MPAGLAHRLIPLRTVSTLPMCHQTKCPRSVRHCNHRPGRNQVLHKMQAVQTTQEALRTGTRTTLRQTLSHLTLQIRPNRRIVAKQPKKTHRLLLPMIRAHPVEKLKAILPREDRQQLSHPLQILQAVRQRILITTPLSPEIPTKVRIRAIRLQMSPQGQRIQTALNSVRPRYHPVVLTARLCLRVAMRAMRVPRQE